MIKYHTVIDYYDDDKCKKVASLSYRVNFSRGQVKDHNLFDNILNNKYTAHIFDLHVNPEHRRKGIATELLNETIRQLKIEVDYLFLNVEKTNKAAIRLYKKFGFTECETNNKKYSIDMIYRINRLNF